jgi:hypothetical protein
MEQILGIVGLLIILFIVLSEIATTKEQRDNYRGFFKLSLIAEVVLIIIYFINK